MKKQFKKYERIVTCKIQCNVDLLLPSNGCNTTFVSASMYGDKNWSNVVQIRLYAGVVTLLGIWGMVFFSFLSNVFKDKHMIQDTYTDTCMTSNSEYCIRKSMFKPVTGIYPSFCSSVACPFDSRTCGPFHKNSYTFS